MFLDLFAEVYGGAGLAGSGVAGDLDDFEVGVAWVVEAAVEESGEEFELFFSVGEGLGDVAGGESLLVEEDAASEQGWCTLLFEGRDLECRI